MRIVFMGTPEYAVRSLRALVEGGCEVAAVFTQPDKPRGRGGRVQPPPAKVYALAKGIPVFQPVRIRKDGVEALRALRPDLCVTAAFGQILSQELLDIPPLGTINVHASLLPAYRGSAPVNWCLIKGEKVTGVTTMMTDKGIDTGDILLQRQTAILPGETAGQLTGRLAEIGAELLVETIRRLRAGSLPRQPQDEARMSYYPMLTRDMGRIDWQAPAMRIADLVRGLDPWPAAFTASPWGTLKILGAEAEPAATGRPGEALQADDRQGLLIAAGEGALRVTRLQAPGGKAMRAEDFLRGHPLPEGGRFLNDSAAKEDKA